ncbi:TPA: hypothetical protein NJ458_003391 [Vibrio parahaemolyticus]|uniref:hypothetical protein n=1 Tax=Vibrio parahaemolyticus TaxID=670 RepID=UPI000D35E46B|nr:hypothetical protein [Vibrio parahaemolyticus]EGU0167918.1 hypothetical protein [Vibrio parahaemolyticus]EHH1170547.1 hypothetical protein [Vibrio parahaemolyticus]ELA9391225.1 hypothetical protein [Vibrio parahaemolyticus]MBE4110916.1 hypothetical protein [Vibrio parahaemolyticus]MBE4403126.1 hypothetical protein [Vibrio parahaemolyticus]
MHHYSIKMCRGDTFQSDYFKIYNDSIPETLSTQELDQAVADGIYNIIDTTDLTITGMARSNYDGLKIFDLDIVKEAERFYFEIPPAKTTSLSGGSQTLVYDIQVKDADGVVTTLINGTITVMSDVTTENAF